MVFVSWTVWPNIFLPPSLSALSHPWPAFPLGGLHCGCCLPCRALHPREALLLLVILPAVPQREVARRQQRVHVLAGGRPHQHTSSGQRWGEPTRCQWRGLWASAAGQYRLTADGCTAVGGAFTTIWLIDILSKRKKKNQQLVFFAAGRGTSCFYCQDGCILSAELQLRSLSLPEDSTCKLFHWPGAATNKDGSLTPEQRKTRCGLVMEGPVWG